ncbi:WD domain, G-beta repeat protein (macronuclear) [Tetrahymena thermophila SB210]|uniref:WD domain, G-beta repeat protein n=1 Tax=Tetrahymena thermophila (strain SB210) TaxID=312017 RepID=Q22RN6_TETTS|nr:WD domain, G-beta repeat protein [Tetrahymena thermophila SB210]EAR88086.2 WD domain, G-beta repeat protein [Tetrahymena thermophila SB210]|eukprot:XP_001008331.2 WD domain, G-beta repeat protein [Tetrahymena thermophila SB210]
MQSLIDIPEKCLAYSANWYLNQISAYDVNTDLFAYGSNSDIYIINYQQKKYETILYNSNMREKISCVAFLPINLNYKDQNKTQGENHESQEEDIIILAGSASGTFYIHSYNQGSKKSELLEQQNIVLNQTIISINVDNNEFNKYIAKIIIKLQNGSIFHLQYDLIKKKIISFKINIQQSKFNLKLKFSSFLSNLDSHTNNSSSTQCIQNKYTINFFEEGQIFLYENNNKIFTHQIDGKILTLDEIPKQSENENQRYILLKKIKNYVFLNLIEIGQNIINNSSSQLISQDEHLNQANKIQTQENSFEKMQNQNNNINEESQENKQKTDNEEINQVQGEAQIQEKTQSKNIFQVKSIVDIEIFFIYNKKNNDLLQSSFTIKSLDYDNFILTGKMGDIYIFNVSKFIDFSKSNQKLTINPLSAQFDDSYYSKVPDTNHYDGIFSIQTIQDKKLITLSIDRRISFFNITRQSISQNANEFEIEEDNNIENDDVNKEEQSNQTIPYQLEFEWQLSCLGAKVNSLAISQVEKELIYMSCLDRTVRVWDSSKIHDQLYVKEYYKRIDQINVKQMLLHPQFENVMVLFLEDNPKKLVGYDLFKEKISFEYLSNRDILNLKWIKKEQVDELQNILFQSVNTAQNEGKKEELGQEKALQKQIKVEKDHIETKEKGLLTQNDDHYLLVFKKGGYISLIDLSDCSISIEDYLICENKNNVQQFEFDIVKSQVFAVFAQLGCISFYYDYQYKQFQNMHKNVVKSIAFKQTPDSSQLIVACACLDRRISIYLGNPDDVSSFQFVTYLKHEYPIEKVMFSPVSDCYYMLSIAQNHNTLQIYNLLPSSVSQLQQQSQTNNTSKQDKNESDEENEEITNFVKTEQQIKTEIQNNLLTQDLQEEDGNQKNNLSEMQKNINLIQNNNNQQISLEFKNVRGHKGYINDAVFSPLDQNLLITCSDDQTVKFWSIDRIINKSYPKRKKNKNINKKDESFNNQQHRDKGEQFSQKLNNNQHNQNKFKQNQNNNQQSAKNYQHNKFNKKQNNRTKN